MFYSRAIYPKLEAELETKQVILITGMRQVGKTTALNHLFNLVKSSNKVLLDLENPLHRKLFESENYDAVWQDLAQFGINPEEKAYIFIDEIQNLPEISRVVKYLHDHYPVKFILTGSSSYYLRNLFPESLAGRKLVFEMFPLTFSEFLTFKGISRPEFISFRQKAKQKNQFTYLRLINYYREFLKFGGFPAVVLEPSFERKKTLLTEIFTSYFEKDAQVLADFRQMSKLRDLILLLAPRVGSRIEVSKLAKSLSLSRPTVYSYLDFLEQTYFIKLLPAYSASPDKQVALGKKLFLCDSGIAQVLGQLAEGQAFEQSVFQSLRTNYQLAFYSKAKAQAEIDFILDRRLALEAKSSVSLRDVTTLKARASSLGLKETYVVALEYSDFAEVVLATDL